MNDHMFQKTIGFKTFFWISIIVIGFFAFFPQLWMINTALKTQGTMYNLSFFSTKPNFNNIARILGNRVFLNYLQNGLIVGILSCVSSTLISALAGYSFSKFRYKGRKTIMVAIMTSQAFPQGLLLLSIYPMFQRVGFLDSKFALVFAYVALTLPVGTWTLKSYFDQIPDALIESAKLDGASTFRTMWQIVFPLAVPGMMTIAIYSFVWSWNDLLYALTLLSSTENRTLASGMIFTFTGEGGNDWLGMMSASVVASIPVAIIFIFLQRYFVAGLTQGAVKE